MNENKKVLLVSYFGPVTRHFARYGKGLEEFNFAKKNIAEIEAAFAEAIKDKIIKPVIIIWDKSLSFLSSSEAIELFNHLDLSPLARDIEALDKESIIPIVFASSAQRYVLVIWRMGEDDLTKAERRRRSKPSSFKKKSAQLTKGAN